MYMFLLVSAAGNVLYSVIAIIGIHLASTGYATMLLAFASLVIAVCGLTIVKDKFSAHDHAHFKYAALIYVALYSGCCSMHARQSRYQTMTHDASPT